MIENKKYLFDNSRHTFVIAEAGSNWKVGSFEEDMKQAKKLIEVASKAGADAVKFQTYRPETVYVSNAGQVDYLSKTNKDDNINKIFKHLSMPYEMISKLAKLCEDNNIMFMSTPFSVEDAKQIDPYVKLHKIASYENNHIRLLEFLASTKKPVLISTGASTIDEIDFVIDTMKNNNSGEIGLMQNTSKYPTPIEDLNLSVIQKLKEKYKIPIGFSDHSMDPIIGPLVAIGMGATFIEKHFTLDRNLNGPDHAFALIPEELEKMINAIRNADSSKGNGEKEILEVEEELQKFARRAIQAIKKISKGDIFEEGINIETLRPGNQKRGVDARFLFKILGQKAIRDIGIGEGVLLADCE
jgi:N,N'-diacetyllegionaminate synthase